MRPGYFQMAMGALLSSRRRRLLSLFFPRHESATGRSLLCQLHSLHPPLKI